MKVCLLFILSLVIRTAQAQTAPPSILWQHSLGGSLEDRGYDIQSTPDGGFITTGHSTSSDGDLTQNKGFTDGWVIKFNAAGNIEWQKNYGGTHYDELLKIKVVPGGGYIAVGYTSSGDGDVSGVHGGADIWLVRLDNTGNLLWQKCLGGSLNEFGGSVYPTSSGGFIVCGNTTSNDGDVSGIHPALGNLGDAWVANLDQSGNILWQHCYGGSGGESAGIIEQTPDGGFAFTCFSSSNDGDVQGNLSGDYWFVKLTATGNISWQKCLGGSGSESPYSFIQLPNGYVIAGVTLTDDASIHNHGSGDAWIVKIDFSGNKIWQKNYGGTELEIPAAIVKAHDGGFFVSCLSKSTDGTTCNNYGQEDYWIFKLKSDGILEWQKSFGGTNSDQPMGIIEAADGSLLVNGYSSSNDNDVTNNHGFSDLWVTKLSFTGVPVAAGVIITSSANNICPGKNISFAAVPVNGGTNPVYHWYINKIEQPLVTGKIFNSSILQNQDVVSCKLTSSLICIDVTDAESNSIKIIIDTTGAPKKFLPAEIKICEGVPEQLSSLQLFTAYLWSTGATTSSITLSSSGKYWLEVPYNNSCKSREYITVSPKICNQQFYFPTAFTPNGDGRNDLLKPIIYGRVLKYRFIIYNRWGQTILNSTDTAEGWDGKWQGKLQDSNIYIWVCTYQLAGESVKTNKGTVLVLR